MKVFLGGIKGTSNWRELIIPSLKIEYFNPNLLDSSRESAKTETEGKAKCDIWLYVLTPKIQDFDPIFEVVDDSNKKSSKVIFSYISEEDGLTFTSHQIKSLDALGKMVERNGGKWIKTTKELIDYLNSAK